MYTGIMEAQFDDQELAEFYSNKENKYNLYKNQYLLIKDKNEDIVDKFKWDGNKFVNVSFKKIKSEMLGEIKPKNIKQQCYFDLLEDANIKVKIVIGKAGTGKSFIATNWAIEKIISGKFERFIVLRNNIQTRGIKEIGFRQGSTDEKLSGFNTFMKDIITPDNFDRLKFENRLETPYLGEIRGRNFADCCVYVSEAQDLDIQIIKTIVSRIGEGSVLLLDGDLEQCDSKHFEGKNNGLQAICKSLAGNDLFGVVELDKCERSAVAALADLIK